ncbi:DNA helicase-like protein [Vibrio phage vB_VhaP_PG11]|nr:DNA helicase-like protein [Vibrio phage vB_VhaP_PG11]
MGFFGGSTKVYVESFTLNLVEDVPNYVAQSVLSSVRGERPIVDDLIANTIRGIGSDMKRYYNYGRDKYYYGLPEGSLGRKNASPATVSNVITQEIGEEIFLDYSVFERCNPYYFVEKHLEDLRGYDRNTGIVANPPPGGNGSTTYLHSTEFIDNTTVRIGYAYSLAFNGNAVFTEDVTLSGSVNPSADYYHARYNKFNENGTVNPETYYWFYDVTTGVYEVLTPVGETDSNFYPIVPIRHNKQDLTQDDGSERYKTSRQLLRKMGLNMTELGDGVHASPDINDVDHAYVIMGIKTSTDQQVSMRYLYEFFKHYETVGYTTFADVQRWEDNDVDFKSSNPPPYNKLEMFEEGDYDTELSWSYVKSEAITGSFGEVGEYRIVKTIRGSTGYGSYTYSNDSMYIDLQVGVNTYDRVEVRGLTHINRVYGDRYIYTSLADTINEEEDKDNMVIPMSVVVLESWGLHELNQLGYDLPKIIFNCRVEQKLKWYQTGFFQFVLAAVSIAITIWSLGSMASSLSIIAATSGITAAAIAFGTNMLVMIAVQYGVAYLVDVLGLEIGMILQVIAAAYTLSAGSNLFNAQTLQIMQSGFSKGIQMAIDWEMKDILEEASELQKEMDEYQKELDEYKAATATNPLINPWAEPDTTTGLALPHESPEDYYQTRIHMGNMAVFSSAQIENYVDGELYLEGVSIHRGIKV